MHERVELIDVEGVVRPGPVALWRLLSLVPVGKRRPRVVAARIVLDGAHVGRMRVLQSDAEKEPLLWGTDRLEAAEVAGRQLRRAEGGEAPVEHTPLRRLRHVARVEPARRRPSHLPSSQWQSVAISGNQWQSVAISGNQWPIFGNPNFPIEMSSKSIKAWSERLKTRHLKDLQAEAVASSALHATVVETCTYSPY